MPPLALVRPDGTVEVAADDLEFPNGSVITPDGRTLIVGETIGRRYMAFDIRPDGTLENRRVWAQFADLAPDGCTLDADGAIWVANAFGTDVARVREGGEITDRVDVGQGNLRMRARWRRRPHAVHPVRRQLGREHLCRERQPV